MPSPLGRFAPSQKGRGLLAQEYNNKKRNATHKQLQIVSKCRRICHRDSGSKLPLTTAQAQKEVRHVMAIGSTTSPSQVSEKPQLLAPRKQRPELPLFSILLTLLAIMTLLHATASFTITYPISAINDCLKLLRINDYTKSIPPLTKTQYLASVQLVTELTGGEPSAMVQIANTDTEHRLDIYIYGCSIQATLPQLALLFEQQGLIEGTAVITQAHTLSISQLDTSLGPDAVTQLLPLQQNIYREYRWSQGTLVQTIFPALYPVTSRSEAEALQDEANKGQLSPGTDPLTTATDMAQDLFRWSHSKMHATLQDSTMTTAHVLLVHDSPHLEVTVTLNRLIQHTSSGLWFVTAAHTAGITIDHAPLAMPIASPMSTQGTIKHIDGHVDIRLFDHILTLLPKPAHPKYPTLPAFTVQTNGHYTATASYSNPMPNQPGLLLIEDIPSGKSNDAGLLLLTSVLLG
jgi:hypothetical protein